MEKRERSPLPSKLSFEELVRSTTIFFYDPDVEERFNKHIEAQAQQIRDSNIGFGRTNPDEVLEFILNEGDALNRILGILELSKEKFLRIVQLVRELEGPVDRVFAERISGREWNLERIEHEIKENSGDNPFARRIIDVLFKGYRDAKLETALPQIYRERLRLETLNEYRSEEELVFKVKKKYEAKYNSIKGFAIEDRIKEQVKLAGQTFAQGSCAFVDRKVDLMIPSAIDPRISVMSSYDETTSSAQSTRATDMIKLYENLEHRRRQAGVRHYFVNVVDGGGWLARRVDFKRMWDGCDFCLNIDTLPQLRQIIDAVI